MSSCFSGGGRSYVFELDIVKSPSSSTRTSQTSSPSSTLSESSNSALAISTRKARTPRKRPNQTYNEAAALLSIAYPNIFTTTKILPSSRRSSSSAASKPYDSFLDPSSSSELLLPFRVLNDNNNNKKPDSRWSPSSKAAAVNSPGEFNSPVNLDDCCSMELCNGYQDEDDFDAESMLDEEVEEGIDSIMGTTSTSSTSLSETDQNMLPNLCYGYPMGLGFGGNFELGFGIRRGGVRPLRQVDDGWSFPTVDVLEISPRFNKSRPSVPTGKKKKKKMEKLTVVESKLAELPAKEEEKSPEGSDSDAEPGALMLKLDYDEVLSAWSDKPSPFPEELMGGGAVGNDVSARLAQIDLFTDAGGLREASVMRYKEKRRTRLFSKKIRYQVRKVNADRRPRMKGRFVRRPNSSTNGQRQKEM